MVENKQAIKVLGVVASLLILSEADNGEGSFSVIMDLYLKSKAQDMERKKMENTSKANTKGSS